MNTFQTETDLQYPWLESSLQYLFQLHEAKHLPHAILCTGQKGLGLETLALNWAQRLLCHNKGCCGKCTSCTLFKVGNHPDFFGVKSEEQQPISVDKIRDLIDFVSQTPGHSQNKMVLILDAERLNASSANALLKVLEEPPPSSKMMLVSTLAYRLPATIKSRCHFLRVCLPPKEATLSWLMQETTLSKETCLNALSFTGNLPLKALAWLKENKAERKNQFLEGLFLVASNQKNPIEFSDSLVKDSFHELVDWLYHLVLDMLRLSLIDQPQLYHHDKTELIRKLKEHVIGKTTVLMEYLDTLIEIKRKFQQGVRYNMALLWDRIISDWCLLKKHPL